jgi:hypothetical protein
MPRSNEDYIKRIQATKKADIEAFQKTLGAKKGGRPKKQNQEELTDADREDAGFPTKVQRQQQQQNPSAMLGSSQAPMAPPGTGIATRPIMTPQSGGGIYQGVINQINQASQQISNPTSGDGPMTFGIAPSARAAQSDAFRKPAINQGFGYVNKSNPTPPTSQKDRMAQGKDFDKVLSDSLKSNAQAEKTLKAAVRKAIKDDAKAIVKDLVDEGRKDKKRAAFLEDYEKGEKEFDENKNKGGGQVNRFMVSSAFHLINKMSRIGNNAQANNTPQNQMAPGMELLQAVAPLLPGPLGLAAYVAAKAIRSKMAWEESQNASASAEHSVAMSRIGFGDDRTFQKLKRRIESDRDNSGTAYDIIKDKLGFKGDRDAEQAADIQRGVSAYEKARQANYLGGNNAEMMLAKWAQEHQMSVKNIPQNIKNAIVDKAYEAERQQIGNSENFKQALQNQMGLHDYGDDRVIVERRLKRKMLDEIMIDPEKANSYGLKSKIFDRMIADEKIRNYMEVHPTQMPRLLEDQRHIELKMKAERHRHLAEW